MYFAPVGLRQLQRQMNPRRLVASGALLALAQLISALCGFTRTVFIARELTLVDYGTAAAIATTVIAVEMSTALAVDKMLLQDADGGSDEFLKNAHTLMAIRGGFIAILVYFSAGFFADIYGLENVKWAFQMIAFSPLIKGFANLDYVAQQKNNEQLAAAATQLVPELLATLVILPLLIIFMDMRAMLYALLLLAIFNVLISHFTARRPFRLGLSAALLIRMFNFSWPLMFGGFLMFWILQGDKVIVGSFYGMEQLGLYTIVFTCLMLPCMIVHRIANALALPILGASYYAEKHFKEQCQMLFALVLAVTTVALMGFIYLGPWLLIFAFSESFLQSLVFLPWIAAMACIRLLRVVPSVITLAMAQPHCELLANLARCLAIPLALVFISLDLPAISIAVAAFLGETLALIVAVATIKTPFPLWRLALHGRGPVLALSILAIGILLLQPWQNAVHSLHVTSFAMTLVMFIVFSASTLRTYPALRQSLAGVINIKHEKNKTDSYIETTRGF